MSNEATEPGIRNGDVKWEPEPICFYCKKPIPDAELCAECAKGNDPLVPKFG